MVDAVTNLAVNGNAAAAAGTEAALQAAIKASRRRTGCCSVSSSCQSGNAFLRARRVQVRCLSASPPRDPAHVSSEINWAVQYQDQPTGTGCCCWRCRRDCSGCSSLSDGHHQGMCGTLTTTVGKMATPVGGMPTAYPLQRSMEPQGLRCLVGSQVMEAGEYICVCRCAARLTGLPWHGR